MKKWFMPTFWAMEIALLASYRSSRLAWLEFVAIVLALVLMALFARIKPNWANAWPTLVAFGLVVVASEWHEVSRSNEALIAHVGTVVTFVTAFIFLIEQIGRYPSWLVISTTASLIAMEIAFISFIATMTFAAWTAVVVMTIVFGIGLHFVVKNMHSDQELANKTHSQTASAA